MRLLVLSVLAAACARSESSSAPAPQAVAATPQAEKPPRARASTPADEPDLLLTLAELEGKPVERIETRWPDGKKKRITWVFRPPGGRAIDHGPDWRWYGNGQLELKRTWKL